MRRSKSEMIYLVASIIVLVFAAGVYFVIGRSNGQVEVSQVQTVTSTTSTSSSTSDSTSVAEEALKKYETNKTDADYDAAKSAIDALSDGEEKTKLESRLKEARAQQNAEIAVKKLEDEPTSSNLEAAEKAVEKVTDETAKKSMNDRIDAVRELVVVEVVTTLETESSTVVTSENAPVTTNNNAATPVETYQSYETYQESTYSDNTNSYNTNENYTGYDNQVYYDNGNW